jgi:hypothetical protein
MREDRVLAVVTRRQGPLQETETMVYAVEVRRGGITCLVGLSMLRRVVAGQRRGWQQRKEERPRSTVEWRV